jgi:hypothetical protein
MSQIDQIERARHAHKSVPPALRSTPVLLGDLPLMQRRPLPQLQQSEYVGGPEAWEQRRHAWYQGGDHFLLMSLLEQGIIPEGWPEYSTPDHPPSYVQALQLAKDRGYHVPASYLEPRDVSYSEHEAWTAAHILVRGHFQHWNELGNWNAYMHCTDLVHQLTGQFVVPDPIAPRKVPYVLDQLWIVGYPDNTFRLIGLEIDGEPHLRSEEATRRSRRDAALAKMGYEIYHAAGWWCRIDPYRVICEFLEASQLLPRATKMLVGGQFATIDDYCCDFCNESMVRWDDDWIAQCQQYNHVDIIHSGCLSAWSNRYGDDY